MQPQSCSVMSCIRGSTHHMGECATNKALVEGGYTTQEDADSVCAFMAYRRWNNVESYNYVLDTHEGAKILSEVVADVLSSEEKSRKGSELLNTIALPALTWNPTLVGLLYERGYLSLSRATLCLSAHPHHLVSFAKRNPHQCTDTVLVRLSRDVDALERYLIATNAHDSYVTKYLPGGRADVVIRERREQNRLLTVVTIDQNDLDDCTLQSDVKGQLEEYMRRFGKLRLTKEGVLHAIGTCVPDLHRIFDDLDMRTKLTRADKKTLIATPEMAGAALQRGMVSCDPGVFDVLCQNSSVLSKMHVLKSLKEDQLDVAKEICLQCERDALSWAETFGPDVETWDIVKWGSARCVSTYVRFLQKSDGWHPHVTDVLVSLREDPCMAAGYLMKRGVELPEALRLLGNYPDALLWFLRKTNSKNSCPWDTDVWNLLRRSPTAAAGYVVHLLDNDSVLDNITDIRFAVRMNLSTARTVLYRVCNLGDQFCIDYTIDDFLYAHCNTPVSSVRDADDMYLLCVLVNTYASQFFEGVLKMLQRVEDSGVAASTTKTSMREVVKQYINHFRVPVSL